MEKGWKIKDEGGKTERGEQQKGGKGKELRKKGKWVVDENGK